MVSMDGSTLGTGDAASDLRAFGRPRSGRGDAAFPLVCTVAPAESGTWAILAASMGAYRTDEATSAKDLQSTLELANRGVSAHPLFSALSIPGPTDGLELVGELRTKKRRSALG